jgi:hypothetical protein
MKLLLLVFLAQHAHKAPALQPLDEWLMSCRALALAGIQNTVVQTRRSFVTLHLTALWNRQPI